MTIAKVLAGRAQTIIHCGPDDNVYHAASLLAEKRIGALPVIAQGKVVGIFSERDVLYCIAQRGARGLELKVSEVMTAPAITVGLETTEIEALGLMTRRRIRHLPVCDGEALVGFVSIGDLVKYRIDTVESEARMMRDYIASA